MEASNGRRQARAALAAAALTAALGCRAAEPAPSDPLGPSDPREGEVPLEAVAGWSARLLIDVAPVGIWTVEPLDVVAELAGDEVVALDDLGRCHVLVGYSGRWTPLTVLRDGAWLGGLAHGDVDPRVAGRELYAGSRSGNLYQVVPHREGVVDGRRVAHLPGREVHTLLAGELTPERPGDELIAFTSPGGLFRLRPRADRDGFDVELQSELEGRVRDALLLEPAAGGESPVVATVSRAGKLELLTWLDGKPHWHTVHARPTGMGRIARRPGAGPVVLYTTCDDGTIWRHQRTGGWESWSSELIYAGPQGPRGVAAGRFHGDPERETVAVFGYSARVELLTRSADGAGPWQVETLFADRDKGHWLAAAELDGRNATDELVLSGYAGRVVLLARPPGFGLEGVAADPRR